MAVRTIREGWEYSCLDADTRPSTGLHPGAVMWVKDTNGKEVWDSDSWVQTGNGGARFTTEIGMSDTKNDRYRTGVTSTWPGDDTFSVTFTQEENVRRYRWKWSQASGTVNYVKVCEDAMNEAQAEAWLADPTTSGTNNVEHRRLSTADTWSEWIELSKDPSDLSLSRLDFLSSGTTPNATIFVETE